MTEPAKTNGKEAEGNFFQRKIGPFPMWMYLVGIGGVILLYIYYRRQQTQADTTTTTDTTSAATVPPFINQTYVNTTPPESTPTQSKPTYKTITVNSPGTVEQIAKRWGITVDQFIRLNPDLANKYENTKKKLPKGTKYKVPESAKYGSK